VDAVLRRHALPSASASRRLLEFSIIAVASVATLRVLATSLRKRENILLRFLGSELRIFVKEF
jgi:hypothetical protein